MSAYDSFDSAYTATRTDLFNMVIREGNITTSYNRVVDHINASEWNEATEDLKQALYHIVFWCREFQDEEHGSTRENAFNDCSYWNDQAIEPSEVTMSAIINAMSSASNDELQHFIGLVDAYRISLWNKPFDSEYYAAIARGFEIWG